MAIPTYTDMMVPLLQLLAQKDLSSAQARQLITEHFQLTEAEQQHLLPSGNQTTISNRVSWAKWHLHIAGLIDGKGREAWKITALGREYLKTNPKQLSRPDLLAFPRYKAWSEESRIEKSKISGSDAAWSLGSKDEDEVQDSESPTDAIARGYQAYQRTLKSEVLEQLNQSTPERFERIIIEVMLAMGYGGSRQQASEHVGRSGDGGIDGLIREDRLGLDVIYLQAKRWQANVGAPEVQAFAGALLGHNAHKGVLITTSSFTAPAREYVSKLAAKIVLIGGLELADLMIRYNVGVTVYDTYELKRVDLDFFLDE